MCHFLKYGFSHVPQIACLNRCKVKIIADMRNFSIKWFSKVFSNCLIEQMQSHISCMCVIFSSMSFHMSSQIDLQTSSQIAWLNRCKVKIVAFSKMLVFTCLSQTACLNRCKFTTVADMRFISIKRVSNVFQIALLNRCKVAIVACVWFFQMLVFSCLLKSPAWTDEKSQ